MKSARLSGEGGLEGVVGEGGEGRGGGDAGVGGGKEGMEGVGDVVEGAGGTLPPNPLAEMAGSGTEVVKSGGITAVSGGAGGGGEGDVEEGGGEEGEREMGDGGEEGEGGEGERVGGDQDGGEGAGDKKASGGDGMKAENADDHDVISVIKSDPVVALHGNVNVAAHGVRLDVKDFGRQVLQSLLKVTNSLLPTYYLGVSLLKVIKFCNRS